MRPVAQCVLTVATMCSFGLCFYMIASSARAPAPPPDGHWEMQVGQWHPPATPTARPTVAPSAAPMPEPTIDPADLADDADWSDLIDPTTGLDPAGYDEAGICQLQEGCN